MAHLTLNDAGLTTGPLLFENLNFSLNSGDHVGLIAGNGRGKSSLLRCLIGEDELTHGMITKARGFTLGFVEQHVPAHLMSMTMLEAVTDALRVSEREAEGWRADVAIDGLEVTQDLKNRLVSELSGGWQRLTMLARAWVLEPDGLLLDEPTNHLDLQKIKMLERWIENIARGTSMIIASHDRAFLNAVTTRTLFLRPKDSICYDAPYDAARISLDERDEALARQQENEFKQVKKLRQQAAKLTNIGINSGSDLLTIKAKQLKDRASKLEEQTRELHRERNGSIRLTNSGTQAKVLVTLKNTLISTPDDRPLFKMGERFIFQGDRIALLGANGTGKTQFVKRLTRTIEQGLDDPTLKTTPSIVLGYADQQLSNIPVKDTALSFISRHKSVGDRQARSSLADAGFTPEQMEAKIGKLSFGQRSRLNLLDLRLLEPNFYILDEPTNHVDIAGQEALETEIIEHQATCVLVSHDRQFIRNVCDRYWLIDRGKIEEMDDPELFFDMLE